MQIGLDRRRSVHDKLSFTDDEWEIKTLSSALKTFLRYVFSEKHIIDLLKIAKNVDDCNHSRKSKH